MSRWSSRAARRLAVPPLELGTVLDRNGRPAGRLSLPTASLNRHVFVCGATGAGKSQTVRALLESASGAGLPWLVVEPAKAEYRMMGVRLDGCAGGVVRIRPGEADQVAAGINPLAPAVDAAGRRFPLQTHADLVRALFLASFAAEEPFPQVLSAAVTRVYAEAGWDLALGEPATPGVEPRYPTLGDLQAAAERIVTEIGYGREITDNVRGFIRVRLSSLRLGTTGRFFEGGHPIDFGRLLARNVVFEIEDVGDDRDKAFLMGTVLIQLTEYLRLRARPEGQARAGRTAPAAAPGLRHLAVFEEAHRLLRRPDDLGGPGASGAAAHAVEMFAGLLAEIRAYGEGLVIAEQIPAKLLPDAVKNTAVKIVHRLPAADDRDTVGATMNLTDAQSRYLVTLPPGQAAVFTDGMDYPVLAVMPDGTAREAAAAPVTESPAGVVGSAVRQLRAGLPGGPLHAPRHARRPTPPRRPARPRPVGGGVGARPRDRMADAAARRRRGTGGPAVRPGLAAAPARLRGVARGRRRRGQPGQRDRRAGQPGRPGHARGRGHAPLDRGRRPGLHVPGTTVAGPRVPVGADPGRPEDPRPPRARGRAAPPLRRVGTHHRADHPRRDVRPPDRRGSALVRHGPAGLGAGTAGRVRHGVTRRPWRWRSARGPPTRTGNSTCPPRLVNCTTAAGPWTTCAAAPIVRVQVPGGDPCP